MAAGEDQEERKPGADSGDWIQINSYTHVHELTCTCIYIVMRTVRHRNVFNNKKKKLDSVVS